MLRETRPAAIQQSLFNRDTFSPLSLFDSRKYIQHNDPFEKGFVRMRILVAEAIRYWAEYIHPAFLKHSLRQLPSALKAANVEALVVDTAYAYIELAATSLGLPYLQTWLVLNFDASRTTPSNLFDWPHENSPEARTRNLEGVRKVGEYFLAPSMPVARAFAERSGLAIDLSDPASSVSNLAVISQTPQVFDYPDIPWFPQFHYTPVLENTLVVPEAPQLELLRRASLCITHAGLNTVLEALTAGVPMVAIPIAYDQPGVAARIAYHGVGEFIDLDRLGGEALYQLIRTVLDDPWYRENAKRFQAALSGLDGLELAANCIVTHPRH